MEATEGAGRRSLDPRRPAAVEGGLHDHEGNTRQTCGRAGGGGDSQPVVDRTLAAAASASAGPPSWLTKLEPVLQHQAYLLTGSARVVVRAVNAGSLGAIGTLIQLAGGTSAVPLRLSMAGRPRFRTSSCPAWPAALLSSTLGRSIRARREPADLRDRWRDRGPQCARLRRVRRRRRRHRFGHHLMA